MKSLFSLSRARLGKRSNLKSAKKSIWEISEKRKYLSSSIPPPTFNEQFLLLSSCENDNSFPLPALIASQKLKRGSSFFSFCNRDKTYVQEGDKKHKRLKTIKFSSRFLKHFFSRLEWDEFGDFSRAINPVSSFFCSAKKKKKTE